MDHRSSSHLARGHKNAAWGEATIQVSSKSADAYPYDAIAVGKSSCLDTTGFHGEESNVVVQ